MYCEYIKSFTQVYLARKQTLLAIEIGWSVMQFFANNIICLV